MFFLAGIHNKVREIGPAGNCACPVCHAGGPLHLTNTYLTPHIFFIPTFRFRSAFYLTCPGCGSVMEIPRQLGDALRKDPGITVTVDHMSVVQDNRRLFCAGCGKTVAPGQRFCPSCGTPQAGNAD